MFQGTTMIVLKNFYLTKNLKTVKLASLECVLYVPCELFLRFRNVLHTGFYLDIKEKTILLFFHIFTVRKICCCA